MNQQQLERVSEILLSLTKKIECPICLSHIENSVELDCSHRFCETCLRKLRAIQESKPSCPICKNQISKRAPIYKDRICDVLGRFTNQACQLIKEKYAIGVEEVCSKNTDIGRVIETSPRDTPASTRNNKNSPGAAEQPKKKKLNFEFPDESNKITSWLDYNQKKWESVTQQYNTMAVPDPEVDSFDMLSVSQLPPRINKKIKQRILHSLTAEDHKVSKASSKRYKSLNDGLDEDGNYNIGDVASETIVKQVELKVIQNMLEDECLANMEQLAQNRTESTPEKNPKLHETNNKKLTISSMTSDDGWNRIRDVKKTLEKREPQKLKIVLEDQDNGNKKKSPTKNSNKNKSPIGQGSNKKSNAVPSRMISIPPEIKIQEKEATAPKDTRPENQANRLGELGSYIDEHIHNDEITPNKSTRHNIDKENEDEDLFFLPTQLTPQNVARQYNLHFVPPAAKSLTDNNNIALILREELKSCIANAVKFNDAIGPKLVDCFTNLLSYAKKLQPKKVLNKSAQTMTENNFSVGVQTDALNFGEKGTQTSIHGLLDSVQKTHVNGSPLFDKINTNGNRSSKTSKRKLNLDEKEDSSEIVGATLSKPSKRINKLQVGDGNSEKTFPWDNMKENQENNISLSSALECSLHSVRNFQKSTRESQKSFKRIRTPPPDSDSDEENPSKRKFLKDYLTVEFVESDKLDGDDDDNEELIPEKCDPIIIDWIAKNAHNSQTIPAIEIVPNKKPTAKSQKSEYVFTANDVFEENLNKFDKEISMMDKTSEKSVKRQKQKSPEHVFTGDDDFEENLEQLDNELFKNEQTSKTYNTELDLVDNTPIVNLKLRSNEKNPPTQILSKGAALKTPTGLINTEDVDLFDKAPSTLNRNLPSETEKCSDDVAILLEDLHEDDFLTDNMDHTENVEAEGKNDKCTFDDDMEDELQNIPLTNFQKDAKDEEKRLTILQNIRLRSPDKTVGDDIYIDSADDEEILDATPKKKNSSNCRSTEDLLEVLDINEEAMIDMLIAPPEGFEDKAPIVETPAILNSPISQKDNRSFSRRQNRLPSVQGLTEFIVTPDEQAHQESQQPKTQESLTFVGPMRSPKGATQQGSMLPPSRRSLKETRIGESGAAKCETQPKYTPLVSTPRSAIKKPVIMTSTPNQKSILNFTSPSQSLLQKRKPCIMWSRIPSKDAGVFAQLENKKLVTTSKVFTPSVTHLVVKDGRISSHTAKTLHAMAAGIWVVRYEWAEDCLKMQKIVAEDSYEALDSSGEPGPRRARLARGKKSLFKGFKFYLAMPLVTLNKKQLEAIIELTGGEVAQDLGSMLDNEEQLRIILIESSVMKETQTEQFDTWGEIYKAATVDLQWFSDCISQFKLISFRPYLVLDDEDVILNLNNYFPPSLLATVPYTLSDSI
ncbi:unnamed protein product [Ceutorhynchus assimilis]|uniref:RING-type E3 ubiquitin transferase BRCA1 n=1 Tax=Ceutorhynchus assimilis TaxID=467358 RepID=A0A9N9MJL0_9CUCU|nr:unnamed protein product [Ceutorhynchus assimilis]